jgi:hypothetical protein
MFLKAEKPRAKRGFSVLGAKLRFAPGAVKTVSVIIL